MQLVFETPRLVLGQFTEQDAPLILQLNSDPDIVKYVHEPVLTSEEQARKIILVRTFLFQFPRASKVKRKHLDYSKGL